MCTTKSELRICFKINIPINFHCSSIQQHTITFEYYMNSTILTYIFMLNLVCWGKMPRGELERFRLCDFLVSRNRSSRVLSSREWYRVWNERIRGKTKIEKEGGRALPLESRKISPVNRATHFRTLRKTDSHPIPCIHFAFSPSLFYLARN